MANDIEELKAKLMPVFRRYNVTKAGIFGSYARGEQSKKSDVDILIEIGDWADLIDLARLKIALEKTLKRKVDLVEYAGIRKELKESILSNEIKII